ncbi:MAG: transporter [Deltaproteobacteria bacterium]|nr:transporter [Deltaproteobacteria bacterium]
MLEENFNLVLREGMMKHFTFSAYFFLFLCVFLGIPTLHAQPYPNRPIQVIIPLVAGSAMDVNGRLLAEELGKILGTQIVPMNKPGASLTLGTDAVAKSRKDGYTIAYTGSAAIVYTRILDPETVPYDPPKDLEPLGLHCFTPLAAAVQESSPWKNFAELIEYAKKNPGKIRVATYGQGSIDHFNLEIIQSSTGAQFTHIPFKGGQSVLTALLGGHVEIIFHAFGQVIPYVDSKKMRILLITKKMADFSELLTLPEFGYKQDLLSAWFALYGPAGIPEEVKKVLVKATEKAIKNHDLKVKVEKMGFIVNYKSPAELKQLMVEDYEKALTIALKIGLRK